jgi:hypothetical protein
MSIVFFSFRHLTLLGAFYSYPFMGAILEDPRTPIPSSSPTPSPNVVGEPLVNHTWADVTHIAAIVLAICLIGIVGIFSRKVEYAIGVALVLSLILIGFFFLIGR